MTWNGTYPVGTISVKANKTVGQQNTTYIETTMGNSVVGTNTNTTRDHFWDVGANEDGRHRFINSPAFTSTAIAPNDIDPVIGAGMDTVSYPKTKLVGESTAQQDVQQFLKNTTGIMQMCAIRAMVVFDVAASVATIVYSHNITSVVWDATGRFTITYANALPSNAYLVSGKAIRNSTTPATELFLDIQASTTLNTVKSTSLLKVMTRSDGGNSHDPLQAWVYCFGG